MVPYFMTIRPVGAEMLRAGRQTDRQTDGQRDRRIDRERERWADGRTDGRADMTKLIVVFRNYANGPIKREIGMPIKLLQSAAYKMFGKAVSVAVVVSALEPILFQRCKTEPDARILLLSTVNLKFQISFYYCVVSGRNT
jgi:hypothetical protein